MSDPAPPPSPARRGRFALAALALLAFHAAWFCYFLPPSVWLADAPIPGVDYETHIAQTWRVLEGLGGWGRTWVYDVSLLAGAPQGLIFDADNKGWELWTWALRGLGAPQGLAFNLFVVAAHWAVLLVVYASARLLRLGRWASLAAAAMASLLWFFDSFSHWCWWVGMVAYAVAGYLALLPLALFYRWLADRRAWQAVAAALALGGSLLVHPYTFVILVVPMTAMWLRQARDLGPRGHAAVLGIAAAAVAVNLWWLVPSLKYWHYILDSGFFGQAGLQFLAADFFGLVLDTATSGMIGTRAGFRLLFLAMCAVALVVWRRERDPRLLVFASAVAWLAALSYLGSYLWIFRQIQPYRHVLPLGYFAVIPAAALLEAAALRGWLRGLGRKAWVAAGLLALPAGQHLAAEILYYVPESLPAVAPLYTGGWLPIATQGFGPQPSYHHRPLADENEALAAWVRSVDDGRSRFLVEEPTLGELIAWRTDAQVLGGFLYKNLQHSYANLFRRRKGGVASDDELRAYFETYAVGWVVISQPTPSWDRRRAVLEPVTRIGPHRVYRTRISPKLLAAGPGEVRAETNRIRVTGSDPQADLVLRYHWMETLVCAPDCRLERADIDGFDPVGFIRVPAPHPADLEVRNGY
jgi:hypothetical protein